MYPPDIRDLRLLGSLRPNRASPHRDLWHVCDWQGWAEAIPSSRSPLGCEDHSMQWSVLYNSRSGGWSTYTHCYIPWYKVDNATLSQLFIYQEWYISHRGLGRQWHKTTWVAAKFGSSGSRQRWRTSETSYGRNFRRCSRWTHAPHYPRWRLPVLEMSAPTEGRVNWSLGASTYLNLFQSPSRRW